MGKTLKIILLSNFDQNYIMKPLIHKYEKLIEYPSGPLCYGNKIVLLNQYLLLQFFRSTTLQTNIQIKKCLNQLGAQFRGLKMEQKQKLHFIS